MQLISWNAQTEWLDSWWIASLQSLNSICEYIRAVFYIPSIVCDLKTLAGLYTTSMQRSDLEPVMYLAFFILIFYFKILLFRFIVWKAVNSHWKSIHEQKNEEKSDDRLGLLCARVVNDGWSTSLSSSSSSVHWFNDSAAQILHQRRSFILFVSTVSFDDQRLEKLLRIASQNSRFFKS